LDAKTLALHDESLNDANTYGDVADRSTYTTVDMFGYDEPDGYVVDFLKIRIEVLLFSPCTNYISDNYTDDPSFVLVVSAVKLHRSLSS